MKYTTLLLIALSLSCTGISQITKRVLFIGNSYTGVNNLPQMTANLSLSAGDELIFDTYNPGGQTFQGHFADPVVETKISQGNWDFVVLQEQSQRPAFPDEQVAEEVFPYAQKLDSMIREHNPCAETLFYMTWGRKNGDAGNCAAWPPICTYAGMDSLLHLRYMQMAENNQAAVSPVGRVWNNIRSNYPNLELYSADESHPSFAGTYAAACTFYTTIFGKSPLLINNDLTLSATDAQIIRQAAQDVAYDSLSHWFYRVYEPQAGFSFDILGENQVQFNNESVYGTNYEWTFGNGENSQETNPLHTFPQSGEFEVRLIVLDNCGRADTLLQTINVEHAFLEEINLGEFSVFPNPATSSVFIKIKAPGEFRLLDISGRILGKFHLETSSGIDLNRFKPGTYLLKDESGKEIILQKL